MNILLILRAILTLIFVPSGLGKLVGQKQIKANFERWGIPPRLRVFIGACELAGAAGLWIPQLSLAATIGLVLLMGGAIQTHVKARDPLKFAGIAYVTMALLIAYGYLLWTAGSAGA